MSSYNGESAYCEQQQDFSKGMQNYEDNNFDRYGNNKKITRRIDLNRTSNLNTMLNSNRSSSRNNSPSQSDSNRFISFKKTQTFEQSKQQRNSVSQQEKILWENDSKNRSNSNLSSLQKYTPMKINQQQLEQQWKKEKAQNVKVITLQLEKENKKRQTSQQRQEYKNNSELNQQDGQINQEFKTVDEMYDFVTQKNSPRDNKKNNQQRLSQNEQYQGNSGINTYDNSDIFSNKVCNKQSDISYDSYLDKKKSMKPEFSKIDQKFNKNSDIQNIYNFSELQNNDISEEFQNNNYIRYDKDNSKTQQKLAYNQQKKQSIEQNYEYKEFEELEQSIYRDQLENKEKYLLSKGIKQKKPSNYSNSLIGNNYLGNITPTTDSNQQGDSDIGTKDIRSSDFGVKEIRSSAFGGETDNSLTSSVKPEQNRNSLLNAMKGLSTKSGQKQPINNQQGLLKNQHDNQLIDYEINQKNQTTDRNVNNTDQFKTRKTSNITPTKQQMNQQLYQKQQKQIPQENPQKNIILNDIQKIDSEENTNQRINANKKNTIAQFSSVLDKNLQPQLQISKSQHQLNYISESSKMLYLESQEIGINQKSRENIALFKQALDARNKLLKSMQVTSKLTNPSSIKLEKQNTSVQNQQSNGVNNNINSVNQNIINSNIVRGSQTTRKNERSSFSNLQNTEQQSNNKQIAMDINNQNQKNQVPSSLIKQNNKSSNISGQFSENQKGINQEYQKGKEYEHKISNQKGKIFEEKQQNNLNYFMGSYQNINSIQTIVSKTELGGQSYLKLEESNLGSGQLSQSKSQKHFNEQNNKMIQSPTFKNKENSKTKIISKKNKSDNITKTSEQINDNECQQDYDFDQSEIQSQFNNRKSHNDKRDSNERRSYISANNTTSSTHYNFINEKSNIINKISGSYKYNERNNVNFEKSFTLIAPSKSTITRQIQLGTSNLERNQNGGDSNRKDNSFSRKQNNSSITLQKTQPKQIQHQQQLSQSGQQYSQLYFQSNSSIANIEDLKEISGISTLQNTQTQLRDPIKSQSKLSTNIKTPTILTNLFMPNGKVDKQRNSQNNTSNTSLSKIPKSNNDIKEIQIVPSQNSTFNFKPSYFTPLNYEDLNDYMEQSKRNVSPQFIKK